MTRSPNPHRLHHKTRSTLLGVTLAIVLVAVFTGALHLRSAPSGPEAVKAPLPVASTVFQEQSEYRRPVSYLGLIKARRRTDVGFEMPGLLATMSVGEGTEVQAGDILAKLDDAKLRAQKRQTAADLRRVGAELELARIKAVRQQDLRDSGAVSREAYDETRLRARALDAHIESIQAQLDSINIDLDKTVLRAPYSGVIAERYIDQGTVIAAGKPVVRLVEVADHEAHVGVAVLQAEALIPGNDYSLVMRGQAIDARLLALKPEVNPVTRAVTAVFRLPPSASAREGEPVSLILDQPVPMVGGWLPIAALLEGERGAWTVLKIHNEGEKTVTVREAVEVLEVQGDQAYVRGTISNGDSLVATGVHRLTPGVAVTLASVN
jgi:RND family efflux transporter MFP subunit